MYENSKAKITYGSLNVELEGLQIRAKSKGYSYLDNHRGDFQERLLVFIKEQMQVAREEGFNEGIRRHTWMKDGVTYLGNGTYTLAEGLDMAKKEGLITDNVHLS